MTPLPQDGIRKSYFFKWEVTRNPSFDDEEKSDTLLKRVKAARKYITEMAVKEPELERRTLVYNDFCKFSIDPLNDSLVSH